MNLFLIIILSLIVLLIVLTIILGLIAYHKMYSRTKEPYDVTKITDEKFIFPPIVKTKCAELRSIPCEKIYIEKRKGVQLYGELRKANQNNQTPTVILFSHGYRSTGDNDVALYHNFFIKKYDLLSVDHEGVGKSGGKRSGFGIYEHEDLLLWVNKINEIYNHNVNIFLHGVSMGGNSVLLNASTKMENVKGIISDCGFISTYSMVHCLTKSYFVTTLVCIFNSFIIKRNIFKYSTTKTLKHSLYPILFIHGNKDTYVPTFMSEKNNKVCSSKHKLVLFEGATHASSYLTNPTKFENEFDQFILENTK